MTFLIADPEMMAVAATDLAVLDSDLAAAHAAAATPTAALMPAAADEVSVRIAHLFSEHAHGFQALAGKASAFHEHFVQNLNASATAYASADDPLDRLLAPGLQYGWDRFKYETQRELIDTGRKLNLIGWQDKLTQQLRQVLDDIAAALAIGVIVVALGGLILIEALVRFTQDLREWLGSLLP
jgi:hypothetical protein